MKILIAEDDEMIADILSRGLNRAGYPCECVYDGAEAAGLLDENRYDLILLDIMLPGADGYELMEYIKEFGIPVIFITAKTRLEDKVKGCEPLMIKITSFRSHLPNFLLLRSRYLLAPQA